MTESEKDKQWFSTRDNSVPHGTFGNLWRHFWQPQGRGGAGNQQVETRDGIKYPTMQKAAPATKNYSAPNVNGAEKSWRVGI